MGDSRHRITAPFLRSSSRRSRTFSSSNSFFARMPSSSCCFRRTDTATAATLSMPCQQDTEASDHTHCIGYCTTLLYSDSTGPNLNESRVVPVVHSETAVQTSNTFNDNVCMYVCMYVVQST